MSVDFQYVASDTRMLDSSVTAAVSMRDPPPMTQDHVNELPKVLEAQCSADPAVDGIRGPLLFPNFDRECRVPIAYHDNAPSVDLSADLGPQPEPIHLVALVGDFSGVRGVDD